MNDVLSLMEIGQSQPWWDGKNIFMLGWSRGAMMTYRSIAESSFITAAATGAGVADLVSTQATRANMENVFKRFIPGYPNHATNAFAKRSAITWPEKIHTPLLLLHGDADDIVLAEQSRTLYRQLRALNRQVKYIEYPGGDHALKREVIEWQKEVGDWLNAYRQ